MLPALIARRTFLNRAGLSLGSVALANLMQPQLFAGRAARGVIQPLHHPAKVKRVIFLYMSGGPSQFETFDHKPKLAELDGQPMPESYTKGQPIAQLQGQKLKVQGHLTKFKRYGQSGQWVSD